MIIWTLSIILLVMLFISVLHLKFEEIRDFFIFFTIFIFIVILQFLEGKL